MKHRYLALALAIALLVIGCASRVPIVEPGATTIPNLAFTDPTPNLDEGAAQTCINLRGALDAADRNDLDAAANLLSAASFYIAATTTAGFHVHVRDLVMAASTGSPDAIDLTGLVALCDQLLES